MKKITAAQLRRAGACTHGLEKFEAAFPRGVAPTMKLAEMLSKTMPVSFISNLLKGKYLAAYSAADRRAEKIRCELTDEANYKFKRERVALELRLERDPISHEKYAKMYCAARCTYISSAMYFDDAYNVTRARAAVRQWQRQNGQVIQ